MDHSQTTQRLNALEQVNSDPLEICGSDPENLCDRLDQLEMPRSLCGQTEDEFCAAYNMAQNDQQAPDVVNPQEIICLAAPIGEIKFLRLGSSCPCGFDDITSTYEHRFVSIGGMTDVIGTAGVPLGQRTTTVETDVSGLTTTQKMVTPSQSTAIFCDENSQLNGQGDINTADVAPSLALTICERKGMCECDV